MRNHVLLVSIIVVSSTITLLALPALAGGPKSIFVLGISLMVLLRVATKLQYKY